MELACTLIFLIGWLAMAGYMNYKIWRKPDDIWAIQQANQGPPPGNNASWMRRWLHIDPLGLEKNRGRLIWFERIVAGIVLLLGLLMLARVIGQLLAASY